MWTQALRCVWVNMHPRDMIGWKRENIDDKNYLLEVYFKFKRNMSLHCLPMKTIEESVVKIMFFGVIFPQLFYLDCWFIYFKWKTNTFKTFFIYITSMQIRIKGYRLISCWTFVLPPWKVFRNISLLFFSQALFNRSKRCYYNEL